MFVTLNKTSKNLLTFGFIFILFMSSMTSINQVFATDVNSTKLTNSTDVIKTANSTGVIKTANSTGTNSTKTSIVLSDQLGVVDRVGIVHSSSHRIDLSKHVSVTTNLRNLTISAWVKPDFSQGSSVFTIVSQENAFKLAISNNMPPSKTSLFSIFDGIKWTTVQSNSTIPEQWTYLAATFNGTSITLYVNDKLEGTMQISGIPTITKSGYLETKSVQNITSDADTVIGSYHDSIRSSTSNVFSGQLSNVHLYDSLLTPVQINQIYTTTRPANNS